MINLIKTNALKIFLAMLVLASFVVFLYQPHFKIKFGGGDNLEWYQEAKERDTFAKIFDFNYYSGRLGPSAYYNPVQLIVWNYLITHFQQQTYSYFVLIILMHLAAAAMVFLLADEFIKNKLFSFLAALSFAIYYPNFETTAWIAPGICYSLSAFFMLTAFYLMLKYFKGKNIFIYLLSLLIFFIGTMTKEAVIFLAPVMLAYYILIIRKGALRPKKEDLIILPYFILSLPIILITLLRMNNSAIMNVWGGTNFGVHMFYRFIDFLGYLITALPVSPLVQTGLAALIAMSLPVLIYFGLKNKTLLFFVFWLFFSILTYVYSNFRDIYSLGRYLYLPSIAWFVMLYYIVAGIKNLKIKTTISLFLVSYTVVLNLFLILTQK